MLFAESTLILNIHWLGSHSGHKNSFRMVPVSLVFISQAIEGPNRAEPEEGGAGKGESEEGVAMLGRGQK